MFQVNDTTLVYQFFISKIARIYFFHSKGEGEDMEIRALEERIYLLKKIKEKQGKNMILHRGGGVKYDS